MNSVAFMFAAVVYVILTVSIWFNYPESWRRNRMFITVLTLWHLIGVVCVVIVFTVFKYIPHEGLKYEITRIGSCYYITTTVQAILFFIRYISCRTNVFIMNRMGKEINPKRKRWISDKRFHAITFILISFVVFYIGYFNVDILHDTQYDVTIFASAEEKELNICLISDIHAGSGTWEYTYDDLVKKIDSSAPDVLFIAGDVFDETTGDEDVKEFARALSEIKQPKYGIYYVYGNHDRKTDDWAAKRMREMGATVLEDEMTVIGSDIQLIGCMDSHHGSKDLDTLFEDCKPDLDKPIIVLTHRPKGLRKMSYLGADLVMAGHTHGFNIPQFLGATLFCDMYSGINRYDDMTAVTTSGVSAWGYHYKWPATSEVVSIHVTFTADR